MTCFSRLTFIFHKVSYHIPSLFSSSSLSPLIDSMDILSSLSGTPSKITEVDKKEEMIHSAIEDWDSLIDLGSLQSALDEQADTLTQHYEQRVAQRNSQQSSLSSTGDESGKDKDNQSSTPGATGVTGAIPMATVVSNQQAMISLLTEHLKFAEHCFLALYKILRRLSHDPSKALKIALLRIQELHQKVMTLQSAQATQTKGKSTTKSSAAAASKLEDADRFKQSLRLDMKSELENKEALYREEALEMRERYQSEISSLISQLELANERIEQLESQIRLTQTISSSDIKTEKVEREEGTAGDDLLQKRKENENKLKESLEEIIEQKSNEVILLRGRLDEITKSYQEQIKTLRTSLDEKISESSKLKDALTKTQGYQEKVKELEQKIKKIVTAQTESAEENDLHTDDDDVVRLIKVNNQLKKKIQEMKLQAEKAAQSEDNASNSTSTVFGSDNFTSDDGGLSMIDALKNHRNRLKRDVEKRDAQIEKLMQQEISLRNQILTLEESQKQYQQRIRFLQNYKVSERSTLITPNDMEKGEGVNDNNNSSGGNNGRGSRQSNLPLLGRGVEHKFQPLFDDKYSVKSITASQWFRPAMIYLVLIHLYVIYVLMIKDDSHTC